jgi:hypothetical protein
MSVEELLRLTGARRKGKGWEALCPAHADSDPSLSIDERDGKILVHCHAGCSQEAVLATLGTEARKLLLNTSDDRRRIVAEYPYDDENGQLLFQVVRFDPKGFCQRRPDGNGGWIPNLLGTRRVLYRLPEVLASEFTIVCEGEKDVEAAREMGFVATCNPGGAGKWREEYSECFNRKQVAIIADADTSGRAHAQQIAASLHLRAEYVKVLELPDSKDLAEWAERGGTKEALLELIRKAPDWKPASVESTGSPQSGFQLTSLRDLMSEPEEQISWLLADILPAGGLSVLSAKPKVGKSTFARCLSLAVARGEPFLDRATTKGRVIYLALEEKRSEVRRHFEDLGATGDEEIYIHAASAPQDAVPELCQLTKRIRPVLIVVDPLFKFVRIRDEKAYAEVCNAIEPLLTLARSSGAHVLLSHHSGKMERPDATDSILGSTAIFGAVDSAIILKKNDRYRTVQSCQRYGIDWSERVLNFDAVARSLSLGVRQSDAEAGRLGEAIASYLSGCNEPQTRVQIEAQVEGRTQPKRTALKALCAAGRVAESGTGTRGDPLRYKLDHRTDRQGGSESDDRDVNTCPLVCEGTREQQSENGAEPSKNISDILVPVVSRGRPNGANSEEQHSSRESCDPSVRSRLADRGAWGLSDTGC